MRKQTGDGNFETPDRKNNMMIKNYNETSDWMNTYTCYSSVNLVDSLQGSLIKSIKFKDP